MTNSNLIDAIDDLLPQTQCGLCTYGACRPYAEAIALKGESINRCPPGGIKTLNALATLLHQDPTPFQEEMSLKMKAPSVAIIHEAECIGCTKCIQACPVDAILGTAKQMHTIITNECTGCELCIEPCPVDCISMINIAALTDEGQKQKSSLARTRYQARMKRLVDENSLGKEEHLLVKKISLSIDARKQAIQAAITRAKTKKGPP